LDLWKALRQLQTNEAVSIVLTTHLLEEADKADCIAILDEGKVVAHGPPNQLLTELGSQVLSVRASNHAAVVHWLAEQRISATDHQYQVRVSGENVAALVAPLTQQFGSQIQSLTLSQPSLEDVFIARTGHQFWNESADKDN
jgi:ABC-2 type transport system ATP-binding protein